MIRILTIILAVTCSITAFADVPASLASDYWLDRYESILVCNSITGGAISEVKISEITEHPRNQGVWKVTGTYKQDMILTSTFGSLASNSFAVLKGRFQAFVTEDKILEAKFKISIRSGFIKNSCLNPSATKFDF